MKQVFISYRHESPEHSRAVRRLGELLRQARLPVGLDQFFLDDHPGGPDENGWPKWCEDSANRSDCVLVIGSAGWFDVYDGVAKPGDGCGAASEAALVRQHLYDNKGDNSRIRVAFVDALPSGRTVPERLRAWHQFRPFESNAQLDGLVAWIASRLGLDNVQAPSVAWPSPASHEPDLADRTEEWPAIVNLLSGCSRERILLIEGSSGFGKSVLLREAASYAKKLGVPVAEIDLGGGVANVDDILGHVDLEFGQHLPAFSRESPRKTHLLRKDLRALRRPVLLIFDGYEVTADKRALADWLSQHLLTEVETALGLAVIVAGQRTPEVSTAAWRPLARHIRIRPINDIEHWKAWVRRRYPGFGEKGGSDLATILNIAKGNPKLVSELCKCVTET